VPNALIRGAHTAEELDDALAQAEGNPDQLVFIEAFTDIDDAPDLLVEIAQGVRNRNGVRA